MICQGLKRSREEADSRLTHPVLSAFSPADAHPRRATIPHTPPSMKKFLPLLASTLLLAGCASDDSINPWSTEAERADARVGNAEAAASASATSPTGDAAVPIDKYSWQKKAAEAPAVAAKPEALKSGKAVVLAIRGDAGLIQIKRTDTTAAGDKLVLKKDGKSLLITVTSTDGETAIANIVAKQLDTPGLAAGDEVSCSSSRRKNKRRSAPAPPAETVPPHGERFFHGMLRGGE